MKNKISIIFYCLIFLSQKLIESKNYNPPTLTIIFIIDQFPYYTIKKLYPNLKYGLKKLIDNSIFYENAYWPHAMPETAPGHAGLNTGAYPKDHGIISNKWLDENGTSIESDYDDSNDSLVFLQDKTCKYSKSAKNIMVDGFSDQYMLTSTNKNNKFISISLKSRSAIGVAGKLGKAIWLDENTGYFTSSMYYFNQLPDWLKTFNDKINIPQLTQLKWTTFYPKDSLMYDFEFSKNHDYSPYKDGLIDQTLKIDKTIKEPFKPLCRYPEAGNYLLELAKTCIDHNLESISKYKFKNNLVLSISLSNLDLVGHVCGPDSIESIDTLYHLDYQINKFMKFVESKVGTKNVLFALTSDHGIEHMPEILQLQGLKHAQRINEKPYLEKINSLVLKKFGFKNFIIGLKAPHFYFNPEIIKNLNITEKNTVSKYVKMLIQKTPGIKKVWTYKELEKTSFSDDSIENLYKNLLYFGRSGELTYQTHPDNMISDYPNGASHTSPYEPTTHVPLLFYQSGIIKKENIKRKVSMLQFANTMAHILNIQKPSASNFEPLEEIINKYNKNL